MNVTAWLTNLGLGEFADSFASNRIDGSVLPDLTDDHLKELGLPLGARLKILKAIKTLDTEAEASPGLSPRTADHVEAERRQLTVMFVDLVGSTELSLKLDPEELRELSRAYQDATAREVGRFGGHVAKYMGDGVLVYFGYPQAHEDDPVRSIYAGLAVVRAVKQLGKRVLAAHGGRLRARVGAATGVVVVGDLVGSEGSEVGAVTGETPNLAFRLQGLARSGEVVVADRTRSLAGDAFTYEAPEEKALKGFPEPVRLWRVLGPSGAESRFEALHGRWLTPLVGREQELALLLERWRRAKEGEGQVVLVSGEAGIGKSRITEVLRERLMADDHVRLRFQCSPYHTNSALYPVIEHLERAAGFERDDGPEARLTKLETLIGLAGANLAEAVPLMAALLSVPTGERYPTLAMSPDRQKERTLAALADQAIGKAATKPVLMIVEDAHWIDPTTHESVDLTIGRAESAAILVVVTGRPEYRPAWLSRPNATTVVLNRLSKRQGAELVEGVTGGISLPSEVMDQVVAKTDGVPLFVEELTRMVMESGILREQDGRYVLDGPLPPLAIPATLHDSLMARLDRLAPAKEVAQAGAAIGRTFRHDLLAAVLTRSEADLRTALDQLVEAGLVFRQGAGTDATYTFKHALVQDAAHESLLRSQRQRLHAHIAAALEKQFPEIAEGSPEVVAQHYAEAGLAEPAIDWWYRAGQRAVDHSAGLEAVATLSKALDLLDAQPTSAQLRDRELDILTALGSAYITTKGYTAPETDRTYRRAEALCESIGASGRMFPILYGVWSVFIFGGSLRESWRTTEQFASVVDKLGDRDFRSTSSCMFGCEHFARGQFGQSVRWFSMAVDDVAPDRDKRIARQTGEHPAATSLCIGCLAQWTFGYPDKALEWALRGNRIAEESTHSNSITLAKFFRAFLLLERGDLDDARALTDDLIHYSSENAVAAYYGGGLVIRGACLVEAGSHAEGIASIRQGLKAHTDNGGGWSVPQFLSVLAQACRATKQCDDGLNAIEEGLRLASESEQHMVTAELHRLRGELLREHAPNGVEDIQDAFAQSVAIAQRQESRSYELRAATSFARLWAERGERQRAHDLLAPIYGWFTEGFGTRDLIEAKALLDQLV